MNTDSEDSERQMRKFVKIKYPKIRAGSLAKAVWFFAVGGLCAILSGCFLTEDSAYVRYPNGGAPNSFGVKVNDTQMSKDESVARMRAYEQGVLDTTGQSDYLTQNSRAAVPPTSPVLADGKNMQDSQQKWSQQWWTKNNGAQTVLASGEAYGPSDPIEKRLPQYVIRTGDSMTISIAMEPSSTMGVSVRPDGRITYLYGIEIIAAGMTYHELHDVLVKELSKYYRNPRVTVVGNSFSGNDVFVMGATSRSGRFSISERTRLLDILSEAGVMSMYFSNASSYSSSSDDDSDNISRAINTPDLDASYIAREGKILSVDFKKLLMFRDMSQNIYLRPQDFIFIPSIYAQGGKKVFCTGAMSEGVVDFNGKLTLRELLLGSNPIDKSTARMKGIYIVRKGLPEPIRVNAWAMLQGREPDIELLDNDIVYTPQRTLNRRSSDINTVVSELVSPFNSALELHDTAKKYYNKEWNIKEE